MGKPIAGQNQFPYNVGGFLVDGAKINGVTYAKKLYIYKQRSDNYYDLQDSDGNIFQFIEIVGTDMDNNPLQYFETAENLVETIANNKFFMKIQDASRGIFGFVRIYQWHKCITFDGDYVFRTSDIDPLLSGVLINPSISTIKVGTTAAYIAQFFPANYHDQNGTWSANILPDGSKDFISHVGFDLTEANRARIRGLNVGRAVVTFTPSKNKSLVTNTIINVVQEDLPVESFQVFRRIDNNFVQCGEDFTLEVVTYPYDAVLEQALEITIPKDASQNDFEVVKLKSVSPDFKTYTFSTEAPPDMDEEISEFYMFGPQMVFKMSSPIEYEYNSGDTYVVGDLTKIIQSSGVHWKIPQNLRPNMTFTAYPDTLSVNNKTFPIISDDEDIATMDYQTGIITTHGKLGTVTFRTQWENTKGEIQPEEEIGTLNVIEKVYDHVNILPIEPKYLEVGDTVQYEAYGLIGDVKYPLPLRPVSVNNYTLTSDGLVTVTGNTGDYKNNVSLYFDDNNISAITLDDMSTPRSIPISEYGLIAPEFLTNQMGNFTFIRLENRSSEYEALVINYVNSDYNFVIDMGMEIVDYDNTIIEVRDKQRFLDYFQYTLNNYVYISLIPLKKGSTEFTVRSIANPEVSYTAKITVF